MESLESCSWIAEFPEKRPGAAHLIFQQSYSPETLAASAVKFASLTLEPVRSDDTTQRCGKNGIGASRSVVAGAKHFDVGAVANRGGI